jgi:uncharacterized OsmC-like protein
VIDNPESKRGPSPMQLVLIGVAGCIASETKYCSAMALLNASLESTYRIVDREQ